MSRIGDRYDQAVRAWMAKHGQPVPAQAIAFTDYPAALRVRLITEETEEFVEAWQAGDRIEMIDALADVLYVAYGAVVAAGGVVEVADEVAKTAPVELGCLDGDSLAATLTQRAKEFVEAVESGQMEMVTRSAIASIREAKRAAAVMGIEIWPFFSEVHESNMSKPVGRRREDGKVLKLEGYRHPDLRRVFSEIYLLDGRDPELSLRDLEPHLAI